MFAPRMMVGSSALIWAEPRAPVTSSFRASPSTTKVVPLVMPALAETNSTVPPAVPSPISIVPPAVVTPPVRLRVSPTSAARAPPLEVMARPWVIATVTPGVPVSVAARAPPSTVTAPVPTTRASVIFSVPPEISVPPV